jgi:diguanylate cyclase (GGDEF)-like protein
MTDTLPRFGRIAPRVLVVDDSEMDRVLASRTLEQAGYAVDTASDGQAAVASFTSYRHDLVLMDLEMPGIDGFQACQAIRLLPGGANVPILMVTGREDLDAIHRAYEAGATDFVSKPVRWPVLAHRVRYMLRASQAMRDLGRSQARLLAAQQAARLGHWDWDVSGQCLHLSDMARELLGLQTADVAVSLPRVLAQLGQGEADRLMDAVRHGREAKEGLRVECRVEPYGQPVRFLLVQTAGPLGGRTLSGTLLDITQLKRSEQRTRYLTQHDALTGLPNRQHASEQIAQALSRDRRTGSHAAVLMLNLDKFKRINDSFGPAGGDAVLREVAERLQRSLRAADPVLHLGGNDAAGCVARVGGDEFALLISDLARPQEAARVALRVLEALRRPVSVGGQELVVTASIGVSVFPIDGEDANTLLVNADSAMSHAKADGGDDFKFYNKPMNASALDRLSLEADLRRALARREFVLHFQPQVALATRRVVGAEALLRWAHPTQGLVSPLTFIPMAEDSGLIVPIGEWALFEACRQACTWPVAPGEAPLTVAVNLSARQFRQFALVDQVAGALAASGLAAERLELEITESCLMQDVELAIEIIAGLRRLGCRVSVDDFGTGYSSLAYLKRFPIDALKIDRSFVRGLPEDGQDGAIAATIIRMAQGLKLEVVAEGVETAAQWHWLRAQGCTVAQGFLLSRPLPAEAMRAFLAAPVPAPGAAA